MSFKIELISLTDLEMMIWTSSWVRFEFIAEMLAKSSLIVSRIARYDSVKLTSELELVELAEVEVKLASVVLLMVSFP